MKDKFYFVLQDCLSSRKEWVSQIEIYFKFRALKEKAQRERYKNNKLIYIVNKLINLPINTFNFINKISEYSEYKKALKEIEVMSEEIQKYDQTKKIDDFEILIIPGVGSFNKASNIFEEMEKNDLPLLVHGEVSDPKVDIFDREKEFKRAPNAN